MIDVATMIFLHNMYTEQIENKQLVGNMIIHRKLTDLISIKQMLIDEGVCSRYLLDYKGIL